MWEEWIEQHTEKVTSNSIWGRETYRTTQNKIIQPGIGGHREELKKALKKLNKRLCTEEAGDSSFFNPYEKHYTMEDSSVQSHGCKLHQKE
jgi:hypothetical protein